ncbi:hypothetical protein WICPIJ_002742 [Wickerhamomyces pijperi]|uniref:Uncharacterized protein n=1 Tax=Wickerhamomyces pijperi TaxID=599730 RepID=A0A9P8Q914_WICPI|nr:hypothetical protein WICPIJ_002742 [Wickerhamomyces pijperi]
MNDKEVGDFPCGIKGEGSKITCSVVFDGGHDVMVTSAGLVCCSFGVNDDNVDLLFSLFFRLSWKLLDLEGSGDDEEFCIPKYSPEFGVTLVGEEHAVVDIALSAEKQTKMFTSKGLNTERLG